MSSRPRGDTRRAWDRTLAHRPPEEIPRVAARFEACGVTPAEVRHVLQDAGDDLFAAVRGGGDGWSDGHGGPLAVAMLAAEVSALSAHLNSRAAFVRAGAVDALLDDYSAVTVAAELGISRQKVYDIARAHHRDADFVDTVPWREA